MNIISSKENEYIKHIRKLKEKKFRDQNNEYIIEGLKMVEEAIQEKAQIKNIIICDDCEKTGSIPKDLMYEIAKYNCISVTKKIFELLTEVKTPQGIIAVVEKQSATNQIDYSQDIIIALDDLQDPGNLGTILRTADSANLNQIILSKNSVDVYNPKVVRSTMGAIFRINIIEVENLAETLKEIKKNKFKVMVTALDGKKSIYEADYSKNVIVIGNEANGVSAEVQKIADEKVIIPMLGKAESLNASVAASIIIYEYVRRKLAK